MGRTNVLTLTCPHCDKQLRVGTEHSGWRTRCPHPDCRRPLTIPLSLEHDDEPEEAVLIAEGPPNPIPVVPRFGPRDASPREPARPQRRGWVLLWTATALLMLTTAALALGWAVVKVWPTRAPHTTSSSPPTAAAAVEPKPPSTAIPDPVEPPAPVEPPPPGPDPMPARPVEPPPKRERPRDREAFFGVWEAVDLPRQGDIQFKVMMEFRADGACELTIDNVGGQAQRLAGTWRWADGQLSLSLAGVEGARPSEVKWNGPDEFVAVNDGKPATFRRKKTQ